MVYFVNFPYYMDMKFNNQKYAYSDCFTGMNTGVQDVHNLAWKLGMLLNGIASPSILQTYESERRPVRLLSQAFCSSNVNFSAIKLWNLFNVIQLLAYCRLQFSIQNLVWRTSRQLCLFLRPLALIQLLQTQVNVLLLHERQ